MKTLRETCAKWLDIRQPSDPETAVWAELDTAQKQFILRGLGIDPTTFVMNAMTRRERNKLFECVKAWAGTAERLQGILGTCRAEQQAEHLRLVDPVSRPLIDAIRPPAPKQQQKGKAA
ncbi:hypothetical protein [Alcanivorax sp. NBRC 102024]|uniref:hypothetical protein n=1 Tax=Alcanivorax sp. NBRC 102024 TaxID=1113895 RepID=UPI000789DA17|nr:hypothetical protein [Alcanivorax sp. NBRC 102024]